MKKGRELEVGELYQERYEYDEPQRKRRGKQVRGRKKPKAKRQISYSYTFMIVLLVIFFAGMLVGILANRFVANASNQVMDSGENTLKGAETFFDLQTAETSSKKNKSDDWKLILVNAKNPITQPYEMGLENVDGEEFDQRAVGELRNMLQAAKNEGLYPVICSAYRSVERQGELHENKIRRLIESGYGETEAREKAAEVVARPGESEHNTGLAADIVSHYNQLLDESQEDTAEFIWLKENCHKFGFILRYPSGKESVTGVIYEPWHFRYVGEEAATEIMQKGICLEEYLADNELDYK